MKELQQNSIKSIYTASDEAFVIAAYNLTLRGEISHEQANYQSGNAGTD